MCLCLVQWLYLPLCEGATRLARGRLLGFGSLPTPRLAAGVQWRECRRREGGQPPLLRLAAKKRSVEPPSDGDDEAKPKSAKADNADTAPPSLTPLASLGDIEMDVGDASAAAAAPESAPKAKKSRGKKAEAATRWFPTNDEEWRTEAALADLETRMKRASDEGRYTEAAALRDDISKLHTDEYLRVLEANRRFYAAFSSKSLQEMQAVWMNNNMILCFHPSSPKPISGYEAIMDSWKRLFHATNRDGEKQRVIQPHNIAARVRGTTAWVTCEEVVLKKVSGNSSPVPTGRRLIATNVFHKLDGKWLLVHHHASAPQRVQRRQQQVWASGNIFDLFDGGQEMEEEEDEYDAREDAEGPDDMFEFDTDDQEPQQVRVIVGGPGAPQQLGGFFKRILMGGQEGGDMMFDSTGDDNGKKGFVAHQFFTIDQNGNIRSASIDDGDSDDEQDDTKTTGGQQNKKKKRGQNNSSNNSQVTPNLAAGGPFSLFDQVLGLPPGPVIRQQQMGGPSGMQITPLHQIINDIDENESPEDAAAAAAYQTPSISLHNIPLTRVERNGSVAFEAPQISLAAAPAPPSPPPTTTAKDWIDLSDLTPTQPQQPKVEPSVTSKAVKAIRRLHRQSRLSNFEKKVLLKELVDDQVIARVGEGASRGQRIDVAYRLLVEEATKNGTSAEAEEAEDDFLQQLQMITAAANQTTTPAHNE
ncbi:unnamed protein product [Vitrella brassicaformis CCMP3155]|uniref:UVR domain-containing protein n=1 Tax=Vitrella brassicaformis (strain CCMP3155) TaxID=1169540 RepID=A0A0G4FGG0_VITBC|nr:unnamed protein product [Vitrella brassicaformis CCMP3155]|eukprot:CEM12155.1 unnamed protein product [Vitrella brassicaformis CCMP3155]